MPKATESKEIYLTGINASPGICIGKAYLVDREGVDVIRRYHIPKSALQNEINRFKAAVKQAKDELPEGAAIDRLLNILTPASAETTTP